MDVTPRQAGLAYKNGHARNLGSDRDLPYNLTMRRNYYVDFEIAMELRWNLIRAARMDFYISADVPETMQMLSFEELKRLFEELCARPFRCRPVYLEGVWGGYYIHRLRNLPKEMRNCAWVFDMIPLEVSIVAKTPDYEFEAPFFTFVQVMGETDVYKRQQLHELPAVHHFQRSAGFAALPSVCARRGRSQRAERFGQPRCAG